MDPVEPIVVEPPPDPTEWSGQRIGESDVERLLSRTRELRATDYRHGGGACLDDLTTLVRNVQPMLAAFATQVNKKRLFLAVADLHNLAGWVSFDVGDRGGAQVQFEQALVLAGEARDRRLTANILYRLGRVHLHHQEFDTALEYLRVGAAAAAAAGPGAELAASILSANQAWTWASMGLDDEALRMLEHSQEQFTGADLAAAAGWEGFFTANDLMAMAGTVHTELAYRVDPRHAQVAIPALTDASTNYGTEMARSRTLSLVALSMSHLLDGDQDRGVDAGFQALALAENLTSVRVRDRMRPLAQSAQRHRTHSGAQELAVRVTAFATSQDTT